MCHWQFKYWRDDVNREFEPVNAAGSNLFKQRGVDRGDRLFVVSLSEGQLYLGGRMIVDAIVPRTTAVRRTGDDRLYDASEWVLGRRGTGSRLDLHRRLAPGVTRSLRLLSPNGAERSLFFDTQTDLNVQATRGVNELTLESADLLDEIIVTTDERLQSTALLTVQRKASPPTKPATAPYSFVEGGAYDVVQTKQERNKAARAACLEHYGRDCIVCELNFAQQYGDGAKDLIHVHHLVPLATRKRASECDPITDLRPLCPNCHAVAHRRNPPYSIDELRALRARN